MGTLLLSRRSWSVHLVRGRPGGRFHEGSGGRPTDSSTWRSWCAGVLTGSLATCPNMALRPLIIWSDTGARLVRIEFCIPQKCEKPFFTFFNFFNFPNVFLFLKNVGKVQSGKQINKKHFQNNSNEIAPY